MSRVSFRVLIALMTLGVMSLPATAHAAGRFDSEVQLTAVSTPFEPGILYDGGDFTSVLVTVTNSGTEEVSVNPLDFSITADDGGKHNATLGEDDRQIELVDLMPGEHVTGVVTAEGKFTPKRVTFTPSGFGKKVVADIRPE